MRKVLAFSLLLVLGLIGSQWLPSILPAETLADARLAVRLLLTLCLGFIMIHVGYEFEIDRSNLKAYGWDYVVAATAAAFPWIFCAAYFVLAMGPPGAWTDGDAWKEALLAGRFAAPTSAGILFSMLAAAGLSATWLFRKTRVLAIFDDLDTVLLMIPLKMMLVGLRWQLGVVVLVMAALLAIAWRWLHRVRLPVTWPWVMAYSAAIGVVSEVVYRGSKMIDDVVPIHIEVLLPAFVMGCVLARPPGRDPHVDDAREGHQEGPEDPREQRFATLVSGLFMVLVGLSMPALLAAPGGAAVDWSALALHTLALTALANAGKMFPLFCYRKEATLRERLALCIGMWPRGEVGAGVLVVSISYGLGGTLITAAVLSLALNLLLTGAFILAVKRLLGSAATPVPARP